MPSVTFFLLRSFLRVLLLLPSTYLRFLSEALEFSHDDFCVIPVTALRCSTLFSLFSLSTFVYLAFVFGFAFRLCRLLLVCLGKLLATACFVSVFEGFCCPPMFYVGWGFFFGRVKGFGMGILVV